MGNNKNEAVKVFLIWRNADAKQKTNKTKQKTHQDIELYEATV